MLQFDVVTLFPPMFEAVTEAGITGRARDRGIFGLVAWNPRDFARNSYRTVDDRPYGGGPGMVMRAPVWGDALDEICSTETLLVIPTPAGRLFGQADAEQWAGEEHLVFACGRYEGIDQRVAEDAARRMRVAEVSIGDYVLAGGEVATLVMIEAIVRLMPNVIGNPLSHQDDSHSTAGLLEGPSYTRPPVWRDLEVPPVLLSGDHAKVAQWRYDQAVERTRGRRPDLLAD
jgi:tRNA (guanine37-N1)-methyltransferase